jgi:hypothetical protein
MNPLIISGQITERTKFDRILVSAIGDVEALKQVTRETLQDFFYDNVTYLELRTTPRAMADGTTATGYFLN